MKKTTTTTPTTKTSATTTTSKDAASALKFPKPTAKAKKTPATKKASAKSTRIAGTNPNAHALQVEKLAVKPVSTARPLGTPKAKATTKPAAKKSLGKGTAKKATPVLATTPAPAPVVAAQNAVADRAVVEAPKTLAELKAAALARRAAKKSVAKSSGRPRATVVTAAKERGLSVVSWTRSAKRTNAMLRIVVLAPKGQVFADSTSDRAEFTVLRADHEADWQDAMRAEWAKVAAFVASAELTK